MTRTMTFHHFRHGEFSDIIDFLARVPSDCQALIKCSHSNTQRTSLSNDTALQCLRVFKITASAKSIYHSLFASCRDLLKFSTAFQSVTLAGCLVHCPSPLAACFPNSPNSKFRHFLLCFQFHPSKMVDPGVYVGRICRPLVHCDEISTVLSHESWRALSYCVMNPKSRIRLQSSAVSEADDQFSCRQTIAAHVTNSPKYARWNCHVLRERFMLRFLVIRPKLVTENG
jgi:hypothetical protein